METSDINFSENVLRDVLNGTREKEVVRSEGVIGFLKKIPYINLLWYQIKIYIKNREFQTQTLESNIKEELYDALLQKIKIDAGIAKIIIVYHPSVSLNEDGSLLLKREVMDAERLQRMCEEKGIYFLDMSNRFVREYLQNYKLPYGFSNSVVGSGHLNKYGHAMIADEIYQLLELEE